MMMASVSGSAWKASIAAMCVVPIIGSPPMPTQVLNPRSPSSYIIWYVSVPDLETRPILPGCGAVLAGIMPALETPGVMSPGQLGPMMRVVPFSRASAKNSAVSRTGTPSVMTTTRGISAWMASSTAAFVNFAGTKMTDTFAPVAFMASRTEPKTGMVTPSLNSSSSPDFLGFTPPTMREPESSMRWVCFMPSEPVMPWTMMAEFSSRKIDIEISFWFAELG